MLQSLRLKYHTKIIGIYQYLRNSALFEQICLQNIKKLYQYSGKCDNHHQFKDILESAMVFTSEVFTNNSPRYPITPTPVKKPSARKPLRIFTNILYVKKKTAICRVGAAKPKHKEIKSVTTLWGI